MLLSSLRLAVLTLRLGALADGASAYSGVTRTVENV